MTKAKEKTTTAIVAKQTDTPSVPENTEIVNDYDIDAFLEKRAEFITKVNKIMVEGKDYHVIQGKKSLAKGGAEKIASIFGWSAAFKKDDEVTGAFKIDGFIPFLCTLSKANQFVGEGRGGATLQKNSGDPNKTIKMAQKSAFIDAVLRASGLSDFFTQDLEDMPKDQISQAPTSSNTRVPAKEYHNQYFCSEHDMTIGLVPAGVSYKTGKPVPYKAFYACSVRGCKHAILNADGYIVKQNPETREMEVQRSTIMDEPLRASRPSENEIVIGVDTPL